MTEKEDYKKSRITSFFIAILVGISIDNFATSIKPLLDLNTFSISFDYFIDYWAIPFIFIITVIRFFIGNLLHMLHIEDAVQNGKMSSRMWFLDFIIIIFEAIIFILMGLSVDLECHSRFLFLIISLLFIDVVWIFTTYFLGKVDKDYKRDEIPWGWAFLNAISFFMILFASIATYIFSKKDLFFYSVYFFTFMSFTLFILFLYKQEFLVNSFKLKSNFSKLKNTIYLATGLNVIVLFIISIILNMYELKYINLFYIMYIMSVAALIDVLSLDIYKLVTIKKDKSQKSIGEF